MRLRIVCLGLMSLSVGCTALMPPAAIPTSRTTEAVETSKPAADSIKLAAECLERGDDAGALPHLTQYVETHPEQPTIRAHLAELLLRLERPADARKQFQDYVCAAQQLGEDGSKHLVHVHTRLTEIAQKQGDEAEERLNRGIGLLLLGRQLMNRPEQPGDPEPQKLLFKAVEELKKVVELDPTSARGHWYLSEAWQELGQDRPARQNRCKANELAPLSRLTPAERDALAVAIHSSGPSRP